MNNTLEIQLENREDKHKVITLKAKVSPYNVVIVRESWLKSDGIKSHASITITKEQLEQIYSTNLEMDKQA